MAELFFSIFITDVSQKHDVSQVMSLSVTDPSSSALHSNVHHDAAETTGVGTYKETSWDTRQKPSSGTGLGRSWGSIS